MWSVSINRRYVSFLIAHASPVRHDKSALTRLTKTSLIHDVLEYFSFEKVSLFCQLFLEIEMFTLE